MNDISYFLFILKSSFDDFRRNKIRTFLTSLGIMIGIFSVVILIALGLGLKKYIDNQFKSLGSNLLMVTPGKMLEGGLTSGSAFSASGIFDEKDIISVKRIKNMYITAPVVVVMATIRGPKDSDMYETIASNTDIFPLMNFKVEYGKLFDNADVVKKNKIIVLGSKPAEKLFSEKKEALGKIVKVNEQGYKVVGVLESKGGGGFGPSIDDHVFIPYKAAESFNPDKKIWAIYGKVHDESLIPQTKEEIKKTLLKRYKEDDFSVNDQQEMLSTLNTIFNMVNFVLVGIAAISLLVGGIGVMNIMYVSVVERIKEIGIRRAFGAKKLDILLLFLAEAVFLSIIGGSIGLSLSFLIVLLVQPFFPVYINLFSIILAVGISTIIGVIFGVFPARCAANFTPIEAMRFE